MKKFWNLFCYAGMEKEKYKKILPAVYEENQQLLRVFSIIGAVIFFALFVVSALSTGFVNVNAPIYLICSIVMLVIMLMSFLVIPKYPAMVMGFVYVFETLLYVFGIRISLLHAEKPAVSAVAFLLVSPLLFCDCPARLSALITTVVAAFCVIVTKVKMPEVVSTDVWNMITFGIVAILTTIFIMKIKFKALMQSRQIEYMSRTDLLTGVNNRNHYENRLEEYPGLCTETLICIYGDVNGLHELNNKEGHPAGDRMLKEIAKIMQQTFGPEHTYRIGGDEFVAFCMDDKIDRVSLELSEIEKKLDEMGYHISFGVASGKKSEGGINMVELVKEAENHMFEAKKDFYSRPENENVRSSR